MDRIALDPAVDYFRQSILDSVEEGVDRADICPGTVLKVGDDVQLFSTSGGPVQRIITPATDLNAFHTFRLDPDQGYTPTIETATYDQIVDRAPADPNEAPGTNAPGDPFSVVIPSP